MKWVMGEHKWARTMKWIMGLLMIGMMMIMMDYVVMPIPFPEKLPQAEKHHC